MDSSESGKKIRYQIRLKGTLNPSLADWLGDLSIIPQEYGETLLVGPFADQSALRGLLDQLWNLNFTVLSVESVENRDDLDLQQESEG